MRVSSVVNPEDFRLFTRNAAESPLVVLPLAKPLSGEEAVEGTAPAYLSVVLQMQLPYVLLTPLMDYQE